MDSFRIKRLYIFKYNVGNEMNKLSVSLSLISMVISIVVLSLVWRLSNEIKLHDSSVYPTDYVARVPALNERSSEARKQLSEIKSQLADEAKRPSTVDAVQKLNKKFSNFMLKLSPSLQEELFVSIAPRRWELDALWVLANSVEDDKNKNQDEYMLALDVLVSEKPASASDVLLERLKKLQDTLKKQTAEKDREFVMDMAKRALEKGEDSVTALKMLESYDDKEVKELQSKIATSAISREVENLTAALAKYSKLNDSALKEYALARLHQMTQDIRLRLVESDLNNDKKFNADLSRLEEKVTGFLQAVEKIQQQQYAEKVRQYQKWAVGEIAKVQRYKDIEDRELKKLSALDKNIPMSEARTNAIKKARQIFRDELIKYMSKINQNLLDEAVRQWFGKVYQARFDELDGEKEQLTVIKAFAFASKKPL